MSDHRRSPFLFFPLVFLLSAPFWALGALTEHQLMPGLPASALMIICPLLAAIILRWREAGLSGAMTLLARAFDFKRNKSWAWYAAALLLMPLLSVIAFVVSAVTGTLLPLPQFALADVAVLSAIFFVAALMEELGWAGYATDPLQARYGALPAGLIIGVVWAIYHFIPLLQADRSVGWIAWWAVGTIAVRVFMVGLYNAAGGSVFILTLLHMSQNVSWQLYPLQGSYYDPKIFAALFVITATISTIGLRKFNKF